MCIIWLSYSCCGNYNFLFPRGCYTSDYAVSSGDWLEAGMLLLILQQCMVD